MRLGTKRGSVGVVKKVRAEVERVVAVGGARWRGRAVGGEVGVGVGGLGWSRESVLVLPKNLAASLPFGGGGGQGKVVGEAGVLGRGNVGVVGVGVGVRVSDVGESRGCAMRLGAKCQRFLICGPGGLVVEGAAAVAVAVAAVSLSLVEGWVDVGWGLGGGLFRLEDRRWVAVSTRRPTRIHQRGRGGISWRS